MSLTHFAQAQYDNQQGYYMFPIRPGQENYLSGSMGELRGTHFHGGLDIKTSGITGLNVYATADGYISRIKVTLGGYGNALYIKHKNGTTSVYAHLKEFSKPLQQYTIRNQYKQKSYTVDLYPGKDEFPVKKGDVIALSGNSGSSKGPHLHFEIRDENHHVLDPARFGFKEFKDNIPPVLRKVAFVTKSINSSINGKIGRFEFDVINMGKTYILKEPVNLKGSIGVEIYAHDRANGTRNWYGIPDVQMKVDGSLIFDQKIRNISYSKMRDIYVHTNYQNTVRNRKRFNKLYIDDGNTLTFYEAKDKGIIHISDTIAHTLSISLKDTYGNESILKTKINDKEQQKKYGPTNTWNLHENLVTVTTWDTTKLLDFYANNLNYSLLPKHSDEENVTFVWDLRDGLLDSIDLCNEIIKTNFIHTVYPNQESNFFNHSVNIFFPRKALFDTLYLKYKHSVDTIRDLEVFRFQNVEDPLRRFVDVTLKPTRVYDKEYARVYTLNDKGEADYFGGVWSQNNEIRFRTRDLVAYTIGYDSIPPKIKPIKLTNDALKIQIDDEGSGVASYRAELNGKWVLLKYDTKRKLLQNDRQDPNIPYRGEFMLEVKDQTGNLKYYQTKID